MLKRLRDLAKVEYGQSPSRVIDEDGEIPVIGTGGAYATANKALYQGPAIVVPRKGSLGNPQLFEKPFWPVDTTYAVLPKPDIDAAWLYYNLERFDLTKLNEATGVPSISREWLYKISFPDPGSLAQRAIGASLRTVETVIGHTERLVAKYQRIKAGLIHDLFTRGLDEGGNLRPRCEENPELYWETPAGSIPKGWELSKVECALDSMTDGPFGSNLKTEHYSLDGGVRVIRLQNIQSGYYDDSDRAFISAEYARFLVRHDVKPGDILVAALGDDAYPVGRACLYPDDLGPAINKADCFRLRCYPNRLLNGFLMHYLNTFAARTQVDTLKV